MLRCRADARQRFAKLRSDVLVKLELLDNKHVQDIVFQLRRLMSGLTTFHVECAELMKDAKLFPIEVDLTRNSFQYKSTMPVVQVRRENCLKTSQYQNRCIFCLSRMMRTTRDWKKRERPWT